MPAILERSQIPKISDEDLKRLSRRIRPVISLVTLPMGRYPQDELRAYYLSRPKDLRGINFLKGKKRRKAHLVELARITTLHTLGSAGREFHPTIAEVLSQIPKDFLERTVAFETLPAEEYDESGHFHKATTVLLEKP